MRNTSVIILGNGQLGRTLYESIKESCYQVKVISSPSVDWRDISNYRIKICSIFDSFRPFIVFNCVAYTNVELAEIEFDAALRLNEVLPDVVAEECLRRGIKFIHFSSDYVFDGSLTVGKKFSENDLMSPLNAYGVSKARGENVLRGKSGVSILRISWIYSDHSETCFPKKIFDKLSGGSCISVVDDQYGVPTSCHWLSQLVLTLLITFREGTWPQILHVVPSGYGSWFEFADLIFRQCFDVRDCKSPGLKPCSSRDYADSVARPANSVLDNKQLVDIVGPVDDWRTGVIEWCKNRARS